MVDCRRTHRHEASHRVILKIKDTTSALFLFETSAEGHAQAHEDGDYAAGEKCHQSIVGALGFLKEHGEEAWLEPFLQHDSVGVRLWASICLLSGGDESGVRILDNIAAGPGMHAFISRSTLDMWQQGKLKI